MRPLVVLGVTGSIGTQTLEVAEHLGAEVVGMAAGSASEHLRSLADRYPGARVAVGSAGAGSPGGRIEVGADAVAELARMPGVTVLNGIVGAAGLEATLAALDAGNRVALANKESLVTAGELVNRHLTAGNGELIPVDSEHSALHQCLDGEEPADVARLVLTASGGPFRGRSRASLADVTVADALSHPTWDMGGRITIDSATLFNKGLEVIEAHHLFGVDFDHIEVVIHPQSIVHSAVEFVDGALKAHIGHPDMRVPIQYALTHPRRAANPGRPFSLAGLGLEFETPDRNTFPALDLAVQAGRRGGSSPAVLNAADEVAVEGFLDGRIAFLDIVEVVEEALDRVTWRSIDSFDDLVAVDEEARSVAVELVERAAGRRRPAVG